MEKNEGSERGGRVVGGDMCPWRVESTIEFACYNIDIWLKIGYGTTSDTNDKFKMKIWYGSCFSKILNWYGTCDTGT